MKYYIKTAKELKPLLDKVPNVIEVDTETTGLDFLRDNIILIQIGWANTQILVDARIIGLSKLLKPILENPGRTKILHNALFDGCFLANEFDIWLTNIKDTMLQERILLGRSRGVSAGLGGTLTRYGIAKLDKSTVEEFVRMGYGDELSPAQLEYAANDVTHLRTLDRLQRESASPDDLKIMHLENKCVEEVIRMRVNGIGFDTEAWLKLAKKASKEYAAAEKKLPAGILWTSEKQVKQFFKSRGIKIESYKDLSRMKGDETFEAFKTLRKLYQNVKLFGEGWLTQCINKGEEVGTVYEGRVHANFNQILETGRFSCSLPNLQQLPAESEHRTCFKAKPGFTFIIADYSGQELAIAAIASGEQTWLEAIRAGKDIHGLTAAKIYGPKYSDHHRRLAKRINFAVLYGSGAATIAANTGITEQEAKSAIYRWRMSTPTLYKWLRRQVNNAETTKESRSLYGRRRDLRDEQRLYTISQNNPIQSTGADIIKLAMVLLNSPYLVLTVHDELILEVPDRLVNKLIKEVQQKMRQAATEVLGEDIIKVDPKTAKYWPAKS